MKNNLLHTIVLLLSTLSLTAQKIIEGRVFDAESNKNITGALVFVKNTMVSTYTDENGNYAIKAPQNAVTLIFTTHDYSKQEVNIKGNDRIEVGLRRFSSKEIDNIVVIGSRNQTRTKAETPVAVDIIPITEIVNQTGQVELNQILHYVVPSFNANRQSGADLADHVDPSSLRGFGPDQVLFLVNGKRYHPSGIINVFGVRGRGNAGTDINAIPAAAVERIEVLRDGAAAQYGSDAVAGVVNIVLKNQQSNLSGNVSYGSYATGLGPSLNYENNGAIIPKTIDGGTINANTTFGFKIGKGNMSITADYLSKGFTKRPNNETVFPESNYRNGFGEAQLSSQSLYFNSVFPLKKGEIYAFGGFGKRQTNSFIWSIPFEDTTRNVYEIFNKQYDPHLLTDILNTTTSLGYRTQFGKWNADFSNTFGANDIEISTENTLNPSLLNNSPTSFFNGHQHYYQNTTDIDFSRKFNKVNLAFGAELRAERYQLLRGDEASWKTYDNPEFELTDAETGDKYLASKAGTSQGFPGLRPEQEVDGNRRNIALYADSEWDISQKFLMASAIRYENYSDFGNTFGGKLASRFKLNDKWVLRGSIQSGFRAPSLTQIYFQSTINDVDAEGNNFEKIVANNRSELAQRANIPTLTAEKSFNQSLGLVFTPTKKLFLSVDGYHVTVKDRIVLTGAFFSNDDAIGKELQDLNVKAAQFYVNAIDTRSYGIDALATYKTSFGNSYLNITLAGNYNKMELTKLQTPTRLKGKEDKILSPRELQMILSSAPPSKFHTTIEYKIKKWSLIGRLTYFSGMEIIGTNGILGFDDELDALYKNNPDLWREKVLQTYKSRIVPDFIINYDLSKKLKLTIGGNNILDVYPTIHDSAISDGGGMWDGVQMGFGGAYFFGKISCKF